MTTTMFGQIRSQLPCSNNLSQLFHHLTTILTPGLVFLNGASSALSLNYSTRSLSKKQNYKKDSLRSEKDALCHRLLVRKKLPLAGSTASTKEIPSLRTIKLTLITSMPLLLATSLVHSKIM